MPVGREYSAQKAASRMRTHFMPVDESKAYAYICPDQDAAEVVLVLDQRPASALSDS